MDSPGAVLKALLGDEFGLVIVAATLTPRTLATGYLPHSILRKIKDWVSNFALR